MPPVTGSVSSFSRFASPLLSPHTSLGHAAALHQHYKNQSEFAANVAAFMGSHPHLNHLAPSASSSSSSEGTSPKIDISTRHGGSGIGYGTSSSAVSSSSGPSSSSSSSSVDQKPSLSRIATNGSPSLSSLAPFNRDAPSPHHTKNRTSSLAGTGTGSNAHRTTTSSSSPPSSHNHNNSQANHSNPHTHHNNNNNSNHGSSVGRISSPSGRRSPPTTSSSSTTDSAKPKVNQYSNHNHNDNLKTVKHNYKHGTNIDTGSNSSSASMSHVKKPLNAFMLFMKERRPAVVAQSALKESAQINQILGKEVSKQLAQIKSIIYLLGHIKSIHDK